jgi:YbbR domain-containing protein
LTNWLGTFGRNRLLKLLSLLLAVALWFSVGGEERTETTLNLALELVNLNQDLMVTSEVPPNLQVRVIGPRSTISHLAQRRLTETLDLATYKSGRHTYHLGPNSFSFPRGVQVIRIQPNPINLTLAMTMTQTLPIKPVLENSPPEGYEVVSAQTRPAQVTVKGPLLELADLKSLPTVPIDLSNLRESTVIATDLDFKNLHLTMKESVPIMADIVIAPKTLTRTLAGIPVGAALRPAKVAPALVTLTVAGPWPQVQKLREADLKARVDTRNLAPGRHRVNVAVELPDGVSLVRSRPETVVVTVSR